MDEVRLGKKLDILNISKVHAKTWKQAYKGLINDKYLNRIYDEFWVPKFSQLFQGKDYEVAVYTVDSKITGCITYGKIQDFIVPLNKEEVLRENIGEIITFYVLPEYWRNKQGCKLASYAIEELKRKGYKGCYLWVLYNNERAIKFYEKFGFIKEEVFVETSVGKEMTREQRMYFEF